MAQPLRIEVSEPFRDALTRKTRYKCWYGGRGSAKSWCVARLLLIRAYRERIRVLCTREFQNSISDSVHQVLKTQIDSIGLSEFFDVQANKITSKTTGSEFTYRGLHHNVSEIKSFEGADICWVEEAHNISVESWKVLIPTIRKEGSEIWVTFNPDQEDDPTYQKFVVNPPDDAIIRMVNWRDNPWFPDTLRAEKDYCLRVDKDAYEHIWEGNTRRISNAIIFSGKWEDKAFETPENARFFFGADWGFSQDPTVLIRSFVDRDCLYIDQEAYGVGIEIGSETEQIFDTIGESRKWRIKADCSRPETISAMNRHGFDIVGAKKWSGSVEDGIALLKSFQKIYIHPRCKHTIEEFKHYRYKVDRVTQEVLPIIVDDFNHCIDAIRYSLDGYVMKEQEIDYSLSGLRLPGGRRHAG